MCRIRSSAMMRSVRHSARRCLTTFSLFTSMPPQHETDGNAKREGGCQRHDWPLCDQPLDVLLFLAQGFAEFAQRRLDLVSERFGSVRRGLENVIGRHIQQA